MFTCCNRQQPAGAAPLPAITRYSVIPTRYPVIPLFRYPVNPGYRVNGLSPEEAVGYRVIGLAG